MAVRVSDPLLPSNQTPLEAALAIAMTLQVDPSVLATLNDPWHCPAEVLPWLAWALNVDIWDAGWPEQMQRTVIAGTRELKRHKGTSWAVKQALNLMGYTVDFRAWWQQTPPGMPYTGTLGIDVTGIAINDSDWARIDAAVAAFKSARSVYLMRSVYSLRAAQFVGATLIAGGVTTIYPAASQPTLWTAGAYTGAALSVVSSNTVYPQSH
jgi:phage tail P2-like protein